MKRIFVAARFPLFFPFVVVVFVFVFNLAASGLSCGMLDLHCGMWDLSLQLTGSFVQNAGFSSCGSRALEHRLSSCGTWA